MLLGKPASHARASMPASMPARLHAKMPILFHMFITLHSLNREISEIEKASKNNAPLSFLRSGPLKILTSYLCTAFVTPQQSNET